MIVTMQRATPRQQEIGSLHKGTKKPERGFAQDLPGYFRFEPAKGMDDVKPAFDKIYGLEPSNILCLLDGQTTDEAFDAWYEIYGSDKRLKHQCDGQFVHREQKGSQLVEYAPDKRPPCPFAGMNIEERKNAKGCTPHGRLRVVPVEILPNGKLALPKLPRIGCIVVKTTSIIDVRRIYESLQRIEMAFGGFSGITFELRRVLQSVPMPTKDGGRTLADRWMIDIQPSRQWVELSLERARAQAMLAAMAEPAAALMPGDVHTDEPEEVAALPAPSTQVQRPDGSSVDTNTGEITEGEFTEQHAATFATQAAQSPDARKRQRAMEAFKTFSDQAAQAAQEFGVEIPEVPAPVENAPTQVWADAAKQVSGRIVAALETKLEGLGFEVKPPRQDATPQEVREYRESLFAVLRGYSETDEDEGID